MAATQYSKEKALEIMLQSLQSTLDDPVFGDFTILCGGKEWRVSKLVLSTQSPWFKTLCESKFKEAEEATVTLPSDDPEAVQAMVSWCYKLDYDDSDSDGENLIISRELLNVRVFALAEKYFIKPLQVLAAEKFVAAANQSCYQADFALAIKTAYQDTHDPDKTLRSAIIAILVGHAKAIFQKEKEFPEIHSVMMEVPEIAMDVTKALASTRKSHVLVYRCDSSLCQGRAEIHKPQHEVVGMRSIMCNNCGGLVKLVRIE